jgi:hypothetical protein
VAPATRFFPPGDLRIGLAAARERGLDFDDAWDEAWAGVRWPRGGGTDDPSSRHVWKRALRATRDEWRAAYERTPSRGGEAAAALIGSVVARPELPERYRDPVAA